MIVPGTFEVYVKERFGFGRNYAFRLRAASYCAEALSVDHGQLTERTLRPLTRLIDLRSGRGEKTSRDVGPGGPIAAGSGPRDPI